VNDDILALRRVAAAFVLVAASACDPVAPLGRFPHETVPRDVPALAVIVVDRDHWLFNDAGGVRNAARDEALEPDSIFRIGGMTEPITALAVMMLREERRLDLDAPVTRYLPEFDRIRVLTETAGVNSDSRHMRLPSRPILLRHLLTHTSGIAYPFLDQRLMRTLGASSSDAPDTLLLHDPGERFTYGPNAAVLGRIVERVSGQSLDAFFRDRIFGPLGMHDTCFVVPPAKRGRVVSVHARQNGKWVERPTDSVATSVRGDTGLFSTTLDYGAFMRLFLNGGTYEGMRLIGEDTVREMMTNQIGTLRIAEQPSVDPTLAIPFPFGAGKDGFGFGFQIEMAPAAPTLREAGAASWGGEYNTHFWIDPSRGIGVGVFMQIVPYYDAAAIKVLRGFESRVYGLRAQSSSGWLAR
jgi:CubicO group peptidase (beta-lactamase class C family)